MFITGQCKRCKGRVIFDIGDMPREKVEQWMEKTPFGECKSTVGWHVEVGKMADYYMLNWDATFDSQKAAEVYNKTLDELTKAGLKALEEAAVE